MSTDEEFSKKEKENLKLKTKKPIVFFTNGSNLNVWNF